MGRVLIEAATAEKSRIASRVGGIPTVVEPDFDGLLVPKCDVEALAAGLDTLMGDPALRRRLGTAAKARVQAEFTERAYLDLFEEFIRTSLSAFQLRMAPRR
jgi:glycosyltransferase involved in cell wall biosynthesis